MQSNGVPNGIGDMYEYEGLDGALAPAARGAGATLQELLDHLHQFSGGRPPGDDRTLLVAKVR